MEKIEKLQSEMTSKISSKRHQNVEGGLNVTATISGTKTLKDSTGTGYTVSNSNIIFNSYIHFF